MASELPPYGGCTVATAAAAAGLCSRGTAACPTRLFSRVHRTPHAPRPHEPSFRRSTLPSRRPPPAHPHLPAPPLHPAPIEPRARWQRRQCVDSKANPGRLASRRACYGAIGQVASHSRRIKRRCTLFSMFVQSVLENGTILVDPLDGSKGGL